MRATYRRNNFSYSNFNVLIKLDIFQSDTGLLTQFFLFAITGYCSCKSYRTAEYVYWLVVLKSHVLNCQIYIGDKDIKMLRE